MEQMNKFIVNFIIKEELEIKQEPEDIETNFVIVKYEELEPIKEEFQEDSSTPIHSDIKLWPIYSDHNYASTYQPSGENDAPRTKKRKRKNPRVLGEPKICSICGEQFLLVTAYDKHILSHGATRSIYECDICGAEIIKKRHLQSHMSYMHADPLKSKAPCKICGKWYNRQYLNLHMSRHNILDEKPNHECTICGRIFLVMKDLTSHIRKHTKKPRPCNYCGKIYVSQASLVTHKRIHTGEKVRLIWL